MLTLHNSIDLTKKILKWGGISILSLGIAVFFFKSSIAVKEFFFPTPEPPPTVLFNKLPSIPFPKSEQKQFTYTLDTISGSFPVFSDRAKVYKAVLRSPDLLNLKDARDKVRNSGFLDNRTLISSELALSDTYYQWTESEPPHRILSMDIVSLNTSIISNYITYQPVIDADHVPNEEDAKQVAESFFARLSLFPTDINKEKTKVQLFNIENGSLVPAPSLSNAKIVRVDFFQNNIDDIPVYYPIAGTSTMYTLIGSGPSNPIIIEAKIIHKGISEISATYPIKTAQEAYEELQDGKGYISTYYSDATTVTITDISLGYFASETYQEYLIPIYVFKGNDGFEAYLSAVKNEWIIN